MGDPARTIQTVTGPIGEAGFTSALAHEHLFVSSWVPPIPTIAG
ncbi:MAG TPA: hypothetical protein VGJ99_05090 [Actinomycetota bacterium]|jgi:predicted metal-dependent phosphotriesterase family hydrolase